MTLALRLLSAAIGGFALHWFHAPTVIFGAKWRSLVRYIIGYLGTLPFLLMLLPEEIHEEVIKSYLLVGGAVGTGVFIGYVLETEEDE